MEIVTHSQATDRGLSRYFTGRHCSRGHISERYVSSRGCVQCNKILGPEWVSENKDRRRAQERDRYAKNPEKFKAKNKTQRAKEYSAKWYQKNKDRISKIAADRHKENPLKNRMRGRAYYLKYPQKSRERNRNGYANRKKAPGKHTQEQVYALLKRQKYKCANPRCRCGIRDGYHEDHIHPIILGGSNLISNIQLLCSFCNLSKGAKHPLDWAKQNGLLV